MNPPAGADPSNPLPIAAGQPPARVRVALGAIGVALILLPWVLGWFGDAWIRGLCVAALFGMLHLGP